MAPVQVLSQVEYRLRLTRPLSAGIGNDVHHLHIREIKAFADVLKTKQISLRANDASPQCISGQNCEGYERAIDGDPSTLTHSDHGAGVQYAKEDHWIEFTSDRPIRIVSISNRGDNDYLRSRLRGSRLEVWGGTTKIFTHVIADAKMEYVISVPDHSIGSLCKGAHWKILWGTPDASTEASSRHRAS